MANRMRTIGNRSQQNKIELQYDIQMDAEIAELNEEEEEEQEQEQEQDEETESETEVEQ